MPEIDPLAKLILDEAVRGLDTQSETLNELRNRTGVLIAAATIATALLGATALQRHPVTYGVNLAAMFVFGVVISCCVCVLWPSDKWAFVYSAKTLDETYFERRVDPTQACRSMALGHAKHRDSNKRKLKWRFGFFRVSCAALTADVVLWLVSIGVR
jgi:hypothetical protein